jgi:hypothetical protein
MDCQAPLTELVERQQRGDPDAGAWVTYSRHVAKLPATWSL